VSFEHTVHAASDEKNRVEPRTLYLVATPIGNLADLSDRAKKVLSEVDFIAAEDTRNTAKLLSCFGIRRELISYFEHNKRQRGELILSRIEAGESAALVTDAGMPAISDPGEDIVRLAAERGVRVSIVPGCCAAVSALALSGLATGRFAFEGFLSTNRRERSARLEEIRHERRTMILYEAPHKLRGTLTDLAEAFGEDRRISLCRELTKLNEEIIRTTLGDAIAYYAEREPRGEYVLVLMGEAELPRELQANEESALASLSPEEHVIHYTELGLSKMDAIKAAAKDRGISKSELYSMLCK
jgi:16S rRNA (cytidine1402-2'-O)-methyltransferase